MTPAVSSPSLPRAEWVRRFADRAMLTHPEIDSISALMIADSQFDEACDLQPEQAAEIHTASPGEATRDPR